jgi:CHAT domain
VLTGFVSSFGNKIAERWATLIVLPGLVFTAVATVAVALGQGNWWDAPLLWRKLAEFASAAPQTEVPGAESGSVRTAMLLLGVLATAVATALAAGALAEFYARMLTARWPRLLRRWADKLHDGALQLRDIADLRLDGAELAYLSACGTTRGGTVMADEAIHLASAFQLAGYSQSVATLWEVSDTFAATAAAEFHQILAPALAAPASLPAALALHATVRKLRDSRRDEPWTWSALLHAGA